MPNLRLSNLGPKSNVFVTGATGLLGSALTRILLERGARVTALVRDGVPRSRFHELRGRVTEVHGSLEDLDVIERSLNEYEIDTVFHLGAQTLVGAAKRSPVATFKANIEGTWNLLEACRRQGARVRRIVVASSDKAYGNLLGESYDETYPLRGEHPYDVSKSCADLIARSYFVTYGLPVTITRCGNFFGPGDLNYSRLVPGVIRDLLNDEAPQIRSDGQPIREYLYVEDGAEAYLHLAEQMLAADGSPRFAGEAFNFSYGQPLRVRELVERLTRAVGKEIAPKFLNQAAGEIPVQRLNAEKARAQLGWKPRHGMEAGLSATVAWYRAHLGFV